MSCIVCEKLCTDELCCWRCGSSVHYKCGIGFDLPEEFQSESRSEYICAPCLVGTSYALLHRALDAHQMCKIPVITPATRVSDVLSESDAEVTTEDAVTGAPSDLHSSSAPQLTPESPKTPSAPPQSQVESVLNDSTAHHPSAPTLSQLPSQDSDTQSHIRAREDHSHFSEEQSHTSGRGSGYKEVTSIHENRRVKRFKGALRWIHC